MDKNNYVAYYKRGDAYSDIGKLKEALDDYDTSINLNEKYTKSINEKKAATIVENPPKQGSASTSSTKSWISVFLMVCLQDNSNSLTIFTLVNKILTGDTVKKTTNGFIKAFRNMRIIIC